MMAIDLSTDYSYDLALKEEWESYANGTWSKTDKAIFDRGFNRGWFRRARQSKHQPEEQNDRSDQERS